MCASPKDVLIAHLEEQLKTKATVIRELMKMIAHLESENDSLRRRAYTR